MELSTDAKNLSSVAMAPLLDILEACTADRKVETGVVAVPKTGASIEFDFQNLGALKCPSEDVLSQLKW